MRCFCIARSGFKCFVTYYLPEHENHVCQVYSTESHGIQQSHHIMGGKTVHPLSKCVLWWHCHISLCSHTCQNSDILKVCDQSVLSSFEHRQRWNFDPCQTDKPCRRRREFAPPFLLFSLYNPLCPRHPMSI